MKTLLKVFIHTLELAVVLFAAQIIAYLFKLSEADMTYVISLLLGALAKFVRASDNIPIKDYVNE